MGKPVAMKPSPKLTREDYQNFSARRQEIADKAGAANADTKTLYKTYEKKGLHKGAFQLVDRIKKMEAGKRADWLRALDKYRGWEDLDAQGDMIEDTKAA